MLYGISIDQVHQNIKTLNNTMPAGIFEGSKYNYSIKADGRFFTAEELSNIPVFSDENKIVYLKDIAKVQKKAIKRTTLSRVYINGKQMQPSVNIDIIKKTGKSIIDTIDNGKKAVYNVLQSLPKDVYVVDNIDYSKKDKKQF